MVFSRGRSGGVQRVDLGPVRPFGHSRVHRVDESAYSGLCSMKVRTTGHIPARLIRQHDRLHLGPPCVAFSALADWDNDTQLMMGVVGVGARDLPISAMASGVQAGRESISLWVTTAHYGFCRHAR